MTRAELAALLRRRAAERPETARVFERAAEAIEAMDGRPDGVPVGRSVRSTLRLVTGGSSGQRPR